MELTPAQRKHLMTQVDNQGIAFLEGLEELARKDPQTRLVWQQAQELAMRARGAVAVQIIKESR